jgi:hypothetical protein
MKSTIKNTLFSLGMLALITTVNSCGRAVTPVATQFHNLPQNTLRSQNVAQAPQILVQFHSAAGRQALANFNQKYGLRTLNYIPGIDAYVMGVSQIASGQDLQIMLASMNREDVVRNVEMNGEMSLFAR